MSGIIENLGNAVESMFRGKTPQKVHTVPWGAEAFPEDGEGRTLHIKAGEQLHFVPIDQEPHNVAEAEIVDDRWLPSQDRQLGINYKTRPDFNERLKIDKAGVYHLVCPIDGHHEVMRLTVVAEPNPQNQAQLNQAKQQARKAVQEARQRQEEARQAVAQAQQQQTDAARQRAQQAVQRAQQARQQANQSLQSLEDLANSIGENASQIINDVLSGVQQGVGAVTNKAADLVSSLTNPERQIGPLGPVKNHAMDHVQILEGTGTFGSRFPNFDLGRFNILDQNRVIGPLGPVVKRAAVQKQPVPEAVMVDEPEEEQEELAGFGPVQRRRIAVRWNSNDILAPDGSVRTLEVPRGTNVFFHSTDGRPHNLVETNANFTEKKQNPIVDARTSNEFDYMLQMNKVGTYYLVSTTDPQTMRMIVKVLPDDDADEIINGA